MSLQWQQVELNLGATQDESTAAFALPTEILQSLKNARVYKTKAVGKRPGWAAQAQTQGDRVLSVGDDVFTLRSQVPFSTPIGACIELGVLNAGDQRIDYQGGGLGSFSLSEVEVLERRKLSRDVTQAGAAGGLASTGPDFAAAPTTGIALIAWEAASPATPFAAAQHVIMAMAIDVKTRAVVTPPRQISTGSGNNSGPIVVRADNTNLVVVYGRIGSNELRAINYDSSARSFGTDSVVIANLNATGIYDACEYANGGAGWFVIYRSTTPDVTILKCSGVGPVVTQTIAEDPNVGAVACYADAASGNLWVAWYNNGLGLRAAIRNAVNPTISVLGTQSMEGVTDTPWQMTWAQGPGSANILVWTTLGTVTLGASGYGRNISKFRTLGPTGTKGTQANCADIMLISKAYSAPNGYTYAAFLYDASDVDNTNVGGVRSSANQVAFTVEICDTTAAATPTLDNCWRAAATWALGEAGRRRLPSSLSSLKAVVVDSVAGTSEHWFMLAPEFDQIYQNTPGVFIGFSGRFGVDLCRQRITRTPPLRASRIGELTVFSGGVPQVWDGNALNEYGFLYPPENAKAVDAGAGGALSAGSYAAQVVWEYRHANGDVARSVPALTQSAAGTTSTTVAAANDKITVTLPSLSFTRKFNETSPVKGAIARVYRTEQAGTVYYSEGDFTTTSGFVSASFPTSLLTIPVTQADATAITHAPLYTTGGILPNFPPPALAYIHTHRNRLFGIVAENRRQVAFTHEYQVGELPGWHPDLIIDVPDDAVALATIDEKLVILCANGIYLISGNGPDRKGLNSDYDQPFRLNSPHGCASAGSVVSFPNGVIYLAPTGFCLVDRQTTVTRIGGPVEDTMASFPNIADAIVLEDREWIYWAATNAHNLDQATDGRVIVFDWRHGVWSVDQVTFPGELGPGPTFVTSFAKRGTNVYCTILADNHVYLHTGSADPGPGWIFTYLKTAPLHLGSNSRFQRARWLTLLGERRGIGQIAVTVSTFQHSASSVPLQQFFVWTELQLTILPSYALKMHLANQVGAFFQVEIADGPDAGAPSVFDDSARWTTLLVEMGLKRGTPQAAQSGME